eukprot:s1440_g3.t1
MWIRQRNLQLGIEQRPWQTAMAQESSSACCRRFLEVVGIRTSSTLLPRYAMADLEISAYGAISGELLATLRLSASASLSQLRRAVAAAIDAAPVDAWRSYLGFC